MKTSKKKLNSTYVIGTKLSMVVSGGTNGNGWEPTAKASSAFYDVKVVKP
ncbi:hypothetical protein N473_01490 [Pseudoalteromonas luteoviolacea CPMOR-1]|uniref:Uncharacterized protein n=1 Tax=Pseudoalteromonas luteoviolacea CPMOR-1 TaxID=1365248 RepID=A0A161YST9_9GAMM|nr:hypothetical protein [Pseudoalteromonas luteoviolacea]KZN65270.1 hypothetical protein N473_01490 [Pseudoalteromonas luteoviolacea CPMOR-1]